MNTHTNWPDLKQKIETCPERDRYRLQPQLNQLIHQLEAAHSPIPKRARQLNAELLAEAFEARFDNVPV